MFVHGDSRVIFALLVGFSIVLVAVPAAGESKLLITSEVPNEDDSTVISARQGGAEGSFISGGPVLNEPQAIRFGPGGNLYVLSGASPHGTGYAVYRYNGTTGQYIDDFVPAFSNGLDEAKDMVFGPDGNLYITANDIPGNDFGEGGQVMRFNGTTGAFIDVFVPNGAGVGGSDPERLGEACAIVFGPDGNLYVGNESSGSHNVLRFNGTTGAFIDVFVATNSNDLYDANYMTFGPDGNLYISNEGQSTNPDTVLRFNGTTGAFIDVFVTSGSGGLEEPFGLVFDQISGDLYVVGGESPGGIYRYDGSTGAFIDIFVPEPASSMSDSRGLIFYLAASPVPLLGPKSLILLAALILGVGVWLLYTRR